jgi:hypothetical protein
VLFCQGLRIRVCTCENFALLVALCWKTRDWLLVTTSSESRHHENAADALTLCCGCCRRGFASCDRSCLGTLQRAGKGAARDGHVWL